MRFKHTTRNACYVITPKFPEYNALGLRLGTRPGVSVNFVNHYWDSIAAQQREGWEDEVRKQVEDYLLHHYDFGTAAGGLYLDDAVLQPQEDRETIAEVLSTARDDIEMTTVDAERCIFTVPMEDGVTQCSRKARKGEDYCNAHLKLIGEPEPAKT